VTHFASSGVPLDAPVLLLLTHGDGAVPPAGVQVDTSKVSAQCAGGNHDRPQLPIYLLTVDGRRRFALQRSSPYRLRAASEHLRPTRHIVGSLDA